MEPGWIDALYEGLTPKQLAERLGIAVEDLTAGYWPYCPKCRSLLMPSEDDEAWDCTYCQEEYTRKRDPLRLVPPEEAK